MEAGNARSRRDAPWWKGLMEAEQHIPAVRDAPARGHRARSAVTAKGEGEGEERLEKKMRYKRGKRGGGKGVYTADAADSSY